MAWPASSHTKSYNGNRTETSQRISYHQGGASPHSLYNEEGWEKQEFIPISPGEDVEGNIVLEPIPISAYKKRQVKYRHGAGPLVNRPPPPEYGSLDYQYDREANRELISVMENHRGMVAQANVEEREAHRRNKKTGRADNADEASSTDCNDMDTLKENLNSRKSNSSKPPTFQPKQHNHHIQLSVMEEKSSMDFLRSSSVDPVSTHVDPLIRLDGRKSYCDSQRQSVRQPAKLKSACGNRNCSEMAAMNRAASFSRPSFRSPVTDATDRSLKSACVDLMYTNIDMGNCSHAFLQSSCVDLPPANTEVSMSRQSDLEITPELEKLLKVREDQGWRMVSESADVKSTNVDLLTRQDDNAQSLKSTCIDVKSSCVDNSRLYEWKEPQTSPDVYKNYSDAVHEPTLRPVIKEYLMSQYPRYIPPSRTNDVTYAASSDHVRAFKSIDSVSNKEPREVVDDGYRSGRKPSEQHRATQQKERLKRTSKERKSKLMRASELTAEQRNLLTSPMLGIPYDRSMNSDSHSVRALFANSNVHQRKEEPNSFRSLKPRSKSIDHDKITPRTPSEKHRSFSTHRAEQHDVSEDHYKRQNTVAINNVSQRSPGSRSLVNPFDAHDMDSIMGLLEKDQSTQLKVAQCFTLTDEDIMSTTDQRDVINAVFDSQTASYLSPKPARKRGNKQKQSETGTECKQSKSDDRIYLDVDGKQEPLSVSLESLELAVNDIKNSLINRSDLAPDRQTDKSYGDGCIQEYVNPVYQEKTESLSDKDKVPNQKTAEDTRSTGKVCSFKSDMMKIDNLYNQLKEIERLSSICPNDENESNLASTIQSITEMTKDTIAKYAHEPIIQALVRRLKNNPKCSFSSESLPKDSKFEDQMKQDERNEAVSPHRLTGGNQSPTPTGNVKPATIQKPGTCGPIDEPNEQPAGRPISNPNIQSMLVSNQKAPLNRASRQHILTEASTTNHQKASSESANHKEGYPHLTNEERALRNDIKALFSAKKLGQTTNKPSTDQTVPCRYSEEYRLFQTDKSKSNQTSCSLHGSCVANQYTSPIRTPSFDTLLRTTKSQAEILPRYMNDSLIAAKISRSSPRVTVPDAEAGFRTMFPFGGAPKEQNSPATTDCMLSISQSTHMKFPNSAHEHNSCSYRKSSTQNDEENCMFELLQQNNGEMWNGDGPVGFASNYTGAPQASGSATENWTDLNRRLTDQFNMIMTGKPLFNKPEEEYYNKTYSISQQLFMKDYKESTTPSDNPASPTFTTTGLNKPTYQSGTREITDTYRAIPTHIFPYDCQPYSKITDETLAMPNLTLASDKSHYMTGKHGSAGRENPNAGKTIKKPGRPVTSSPVKKNSAMSVTSSRQKDSTIYSGKTQGTDRDKFLNERRTLTKEHMNDGAAYFNSRGCLSGALPQGVARGNAGRDKMKLPTSGLQHKAVIKVR